MSTIHALHPKAITISERIYSINQLTYLADKQGVNWYRKGHRVITRHTVTGKGESLGKLLLGLQLPDS